MITVVERLGTRLGSIEILGKLFFHLTLSAWHYHGSDTTTSPRAILLDRSLLGAIKL